MEQAAPPSPDDALLLAVGEALPLPCAVVLPMDGRVLFANGALLTLLGMTGPYLIGDCIDRIFSGPAEGPGLRQQLLAGAVPRQIPTLLRRQDGTPVAASLLPGVVGESAAALAVLLFLPLAPANGSETPTALDALTQARPLATEAQSWLRRIEQAARQTP